MFSDTEGQWLVILRDNGYTDGKWCSDTEGQWLVILRDNGYTDGKWCYKRAVISEDRLLLIKNLLPVEFQLLHFCNILV